MKKLTLIVGGFAAAFMAGPSLAADAAAGQAKAAVCAGCHGPTGISSNPLWPNIAGQKDQYLVKQMKAFRDGVREDPLMTPMSTGLTDEDIENLAAFYAAQTCSN